MGWPAADATAIAFVEQLLDEGSRFRIGEDGTNPGTHEARPAREGGDGDKLGPEQQIDVVDRLDVDAPGPRQGSHTTLR